MCRRIITEHQSNSTKTLFSMYIKGEQYPYSQWDGNQLKCKSEVRRINIIDINHGIEYKEDKWQIQEKSLITNGKNEGYKSKHTFEFQTGKKRNVTLMKKRIIGITMNRKAKNRSRRK